jgi:hypothetical protein
MYSWQNKPVKRPGWGRAWLFDCRPRRLGASIVRAVEAEKSAPFLRVDLAIKLPGNGLAPGSRNAIYKNQGEHQAMNEWQSAYSTIAEVAATLSGLLFVSLSVKLNAASNEEREWVLVIAKRSFLDFLAVLGIAMFFLVPSISHILIGWAVLWLSATRAMWHVRYLRTYHGSVDLKPTPREYVIPVVATVVLTTAGVAMLLSYAVAPKLIYSAAIVLLFGACQNAWRLLIR